MSTLDVFNKNTPAYDAWFDENCLLYQAEVEAVRGFMPAHASGVEIGVGTGRFALPLGITLGVEPSHSMAALARLRGITVLEGCAEALPLTDKSFGFALMVTVVCFLDDIVLAFKEVSRILKPKGVFIIGFIEKDSEKGRHYNRQKGRDGFFRDATFYSAGELEAGLQQAGFAGFDYRQTLLPGRMGLQVVEKGHAQGSFVVLRAMTTKGAMQL